MCVLGACLKLCFFRHECVCVCVCVCVRERERERERKRERERMRPGQSAEAKNNTLLCATAFHVAYSAALAK